MFDKSSQILALQKKARDKTLTDNERIVSHKMALKLIAKHGEPKSQPTKRHTRPPDYEKTITYWIVPILKSAYANPQYRQYIEEPLRARGLKEDRHNGSMVWKIKSKVLAADLHRLMYKLAINQDYAEMDILRKRAQQRKDTIAQKNKTRSNLFILGLWIAFPIILALIVF